MRPFQYARPRQLSEALGLYGEYGSRARVLAGGTDVIVRLSRGHMRPDLLLDIKDIAEFSNRIVETDGVLRFGAGVVMTDVVADARVQRHFTALIEAASVVGSIQIRTRATIAGNICNASPAADTVPALLAYGGIVNVVGASGRRQVPLVDFQLGPGKTVLTPGELVESVDLPLPSGRTGSAFGRITRRFGVDLATINLVCRVDASGETRFAYGAVAPRILLLVDSTGALGDPGASEDAKRGALKALIDQARPISDVRGSRDYRLGMLDVMSRRALATSLERLKS